MRIHRYFPRLRAAVLLGAMVIPFVASACSSSDDTPAVANVGLSVNKPRVALGSPIDLTYRFEVLPGASIANDYTVFVHVIADGQLLWTDDHQPAVPTSKWQPGQKVEYTRTRFVPVVPYLGTATVEIGLYRDGERLSLSGSDPADRETTERSYAVGSLELLPTSENIFVIYKTGWHPMEFPENDPTTSWQWTQKTGVLSFRNPKQDATLFFEYDARPDIFPGQPQQVTISSGGQVITKFEAAARDQVLHRFPITAAQLGTADMTELAIDVDRTFVPANLPAGGKDTRELGIRVYHAFIETR